jgi:hypothetical protein
MLESGSGIWDENMFGSGSGIKHLGSAIRVLTTGMSFTMSRGINTVPVLVRDHGTRELAQELYKNYL